MQGDEPAEEAAGMLGNNEPVGNMVLRAVAMPADTNSNGAIFGGWILSQMDLAGSILASELAGSRMVTVAVNDMTFIKPVDVGDVVSCYAQVGKVGTTSACIHIQVWVKTGFRQSDQLTSEVKVAQGQYIYVAIDENGNSWPIRRSAASE